MEIVDKTPDPQPWPLTPRGNEPEYTLEVKGTERELIWLIDALTRSAEYPAAGGDALSLLIEFRHLLCDATGLVRA